MSNSFATTWTVMNPARLLCPWWDFQARMLEWAATSFSRGSSQPRDQTHVSCIGRWILYYWAHQGSSFGLECCSNPLCLHWFYLDDISIVENGVLKFPDTVLLFIFPFSSVSFCFIYLDAQYSWSPKYNCFKIFVWQIWNLCFCKDGYWVFVLLLWMDHVSFLLCVTWDLLLNIKHRKNEEPLQVFADWLWVEKKFHQFTQPEGLILFQPFLDLCLPWVCARALP